MQHIQLLFIEANPLNETGRFTLSWTLTKAKLNVMRKL